MVCDFCHGRDLRHRGVCENSVAPRFLDRDSSPSSASVRRKPTLEGDFRFPGGTSRSRDLRPFSWRRRNGRAGARSLDVSALQSCWLPQRAVGYARTASIVCIDRNRPLPETICSSLSKCQTSRNCSDIGVRWASANRTARRLCLPHNTVNQNVCLSLEIARTPC